MSSVGGASEASGAQLRNAPPRQQPQRKAPAWLTDWLHPSPDAWQAGVRRASRAALVTTLALAFAKLVIGNAQVTTFVSFGCFAHLVMADFGGQRRPRALAYLSLTLIGAVFVALGTLASPIIWLGAALMFVVGFCVAFASVFGGYAHAAQTALLLSFVLAVSIPAPLSALPNRELGWFIAGSVSLFAGVFLWPRFERIALRQSAATACQAFAALILAERDAQRVSQDDAQRADRFAERERRQRAAEQAVAVARQKYTSAPQRPAGPAQRDRAFVELLTEFDRMLALMTHPVGAEQTTPRPTIGESDQLAASVAATLRASASALTGGPLPDLMTLQRARLAHRQALDEWAAAALRDGQPPEAVLDGLEVDDALRALAYLTLAIGASATLVAGGQLTNVPMLPIGVPLEQGAPGVAIRIARTARAHLAPSSSVLHNSLRVGVGLALAVALARSLQLSHAFWVVLGTLSVLRSNALATGRTTVQALVGALIGFALGALFLIVAGTNQMALWIVFPFTIFLAAYAQSAIGFIAGQAAFTLVVLIIFNLIAPVGWRLGIARIEDVGVGVAVSVVVGLLLWPRGARSELRREAAELYRAIATFLASVFDRTLADGTEQRVIQARGQALIARERANETLDQYLREQAAKPLAPEVAAALVAGGAEAIMAGDILDQFTGMGYRARADVHDVGPIMAEAQTLVGEFRRLADQLNGVESHARGDPEPTDQAPQRVIRESALASLRHWRAHLDEVNEGRAALAVVVADQWIRHLSDLATSLEKPVSAVVAAAPRLRPIRWLRRPLKSTRPASASAASTQTPPTPPPAQR